MYLAIIGAGESSRLKAEGLKVPKHLIKLKGEYLIDRIIRISKNNNLSRIVCIINENEPALKEYLLNADFGIEFKLIVKTTASSMHSLFTLAPYISKDPFCLTTTDSVFNGKEFSGFISYSSLQKDVHCVLAVTDFIDDEKPLCTALDNNFNITGFSDLRENYSWATGGIYYMQPDIFNEMDTALGRNISRLRNYFRLLLEKGYKLKAYPFSKIIDVDHVSDIKKAELFLEEQENI
jgi:NDP-sugar pyrophosphorylase family protein